MIFEPLPISGAWRIDLERRGDDRGFFARLFCAEEFAHHGIATTWVQVNTSFNQTIGTLRGMHFQRPPAAEAKLVRCLSGELYDVLVDVRSGSNGFGQWTSVDLNSQNRSMVYIPQGVAHGFQTLKPQTEVLYFHSAPYAPELEGGLRFDDPAVGIDWPLPPAELSARDRTHPLLKDLEPIQL